MGNHFLKMPRHLHQTFHIPIILFSHSTVVSNLTGPSTTLKTSKHQSDVLERDLTYGFRRLYKRVVILVMFPGEMQRKCTRRSTGSKQGLFHGTLLNSSTESRRHLHHRNGCKKSMN